MLILISITAKTAISFSLFCLMHKVCSFIWNGCFFIIFRLSVCVWRLVRLVIIRVNNDKFRSVCYVCWRKHAWAFFVHHLNSFILLSLSVELVWENNIPFAFYKGNETFSDGLWVGTGFAAIHNHVPIIDITQI